MLDTSRNLQTHPLTDREKQLQFVLEGSALGFWDWNIVTGKVDRNERWATMLGYRPEEIEFTTRQWSDFIYPGDRDRAWQSIHAVLEGESDIHRIEYRMLHKDGSIRWILDQANVMQRDAAGKPTRMCGTHTDVTERRQAEAELEEYRRQLEALVEARTTELALAKEAAETANIAKSAFLANMSHEMRTPLHQISGMATLIGMEPLGARQRERLQTLNSSCQNLTAMIDRVLELSKLEARKVDLTEENVDIAELVDDVLTNVRPQAEAKHLALHLAPLPDFGKLRGAANHIRIGLLNYLNNAIRFTSSGQVSLSIRQVEEDACSALIRFEVEDTGIGIATADQARLFNLFEQVDNSPTRRFGGLGASLAMTKKIANLMGGDAGCESELGMGSLFWFAIRLRKG